MKVAITRHFSNGDFSEAVHRDNCGEVMRIMAGRYPDKLITEGKWVKITELYDVSLLSNIS